MANAARRKFLGWEKPFLQLAIPAWIEFVETNGIDAGSCVIVLPGRRAARRVEERIAELAPASWAPPRVVAEGELAQALRKRRARLASGWERALSWREALENVGESVRKDLWGAESVGSAGLARLCARTFRELAAEGVAAAEVARAAETKPAIGSVARWQAYADVEARYVALLAKRGAIDPAAAAREALAAELDGALHVQLLAIVDPPRALRKLLARVPVTAFVFAPEAEASHFDELGTLELAHWSERSAGIDAQRWRCVEDPDEQARAAVVHLAEGALRPEELAIGLADLDVRPFVERRLIEAGSEPRWAGGSALVESRPAQLVLRALRWCASQSVEDFAALVRHPEWDALCGCGGGELAAALDAFAAAHAPARIDGTWPTQVDKHERQGVERLKAAVTRAKESLATGDGWAAALQRLLLAAYPTVNLGARDPLGWRHARALEALAREVLELGEFERSASRALEAQELAELVEDELGLTELPPHPASGERPLVEVFGWLELALDDAPRLALCGLNEGALPSRGATGGLLGEPARRELGLVDERRRSARDVWALAAILASRPGTLLLSGRRNSEGDPLRPSRLVFRCADAELVERVRAAFPEHPAELPAPEGSPEAFVPRIEETPLPTRISPTGFRTYLQSPLAYYFGYVLRLDTADEAGLELDPLAFGNLAHEAAAILAREDLRACADEPLLAQALSEELDQIVQRRFGSAVQVAVLLQVEKLRGRLLGLARWQARQAATGWVVEHAERAFGPKRLGAMDVDGRIDRIDYNTRLQRWRIVDYKTSESGATPKSVHVRKGEWKDLQLPLYAWLTEELRAQKPGPCELGYITLSKSVDEELFRAFELEPDDHASALQRALEVVEAIQRREFSHPGDAAPADRSLAAACGFGLLADVGADEGAEGEAVEA
jgi:RecB family exonuclease